MNPEPIQMLDAPPDEAERARVIRAVEQRISHRRPGGARLSVVLQNVRYRDECWYVPILPDKRPPNRYVPTLAEVANELGRDENLIIVFEPTRLDSNDQR